jgi:trans-aconitate 3-methyltransferase
MLKLSFLANSRIWSEFTSQVRLPTALFIICRSRGLGYFKGDYYPDLPNPRPVIMRKKMPWEGLLSYLYTFSSLQNYHEKYPADKDDPDGDIAQRFFKELQKHASQKDGGSSSEVEVEWPMALIVARRR